MQRLKLSRGIKVNSVSLPLSFFQFRHANLSSLRRLRLPRWISECLRLISLDAETVSIIKFMCRQNQKLFPFRSVSNIDEIAPANQSSEICSDEASFVTLWLSVFCCYHSHLKLFALSKALSVRRNSRQTPGRARRKTWCGNKEENQ